MPPKKETEPLKAQRRQPATTPEDREQQMISLADTVAEKQMLAGTASSQVITHYLKLGTSRERLEQEKIKRENLLLEAKNSEMASRGRAEDLVAQVLEKMKLYAGVDDDDDD